MPVERFAELKPDLLSGCDSFCLAQRFRCASAILFRAAALSFQRLRTGDSMGEGFGRHSCDLPESQLGDGWIHHTQLKSTLRRTPFANYMTHVDSNSSGFRAKTAFCTSDLLVFAPEEI